MGTDPAAGDLAVGQGRSPTAESEEGHRRQVRGHRPSRFSARAVGLRRSICTDASPGGRMPQSGEDRKSTRLNSSHVSISYAVFCLKKKKRKLEVQEDKT